MEHYIINKVFVSPAPRLRAGFFNPRLRAFRWFILILRNLTLQSLPSLPLTALLASLLHLEFSLHSILQLPVN
jgi:hypothetical protein